MSVGSGGKDVIFALSHNLVTLRYGDIPALAAEVAKRDILDVPACGHIQPYIDLTLRMVSEHTIRPQDVEAVTVWGGPNTRTVCEPAEIRRRPRNMRAGGGHHRGKAPHFTRLSRGS